MCLPTDRPPSSSAKPKTKHQRARAASFDSFFFEKHASELSEAPVFKADSPRCVTVYCHIDIGNAGGNNDGDAKNLTFEIRGGGDGARIGGNGAVPSASPETDHKSRKKKKEAGAARVKFSTVETREYSRVIGDNPSCTTGLALELGWEYEVAGTASVDEAEGARGPKRPHEEMKLGRMERWELLREAGGYTDRELQRAERRAMVKERTEFFGGK